jgi:quinol monooxygenase YgiN/uncharacterized protein (DUF1330 family)
MKGKVIWMWVAVLMGLCMGRATSAQEAPVPYVRWADLDIDSARLESFEAAAKAHIDAAARLEPGLLALHVVSSKSTPTRVRVFEMYADEAAYRAHLETPHFKTFVAVTQPMITQRKLFDATPIRLGAKTALPAAPLVRVADLRIDPAQLDAYRAAVTEEIDASILLEPGVLGIYSTALNEDPTQLRFFEIYADDAAYRAHIASPHFKKYVETTRNMITARELFEMNTIRLSMKSPAAPSASGPAIYVSEFEVTDPEGMKPYSAGVDATFKPFGGRYLVRGGQVETREGTPSKRIVMIEFPSMERAQAWYDSPAYVALRPIRQKASTARVYIVQGTPR